MPNRGSLPPRGYLKMRPACFEYQDGQKQKTDAVAVAYGSENRVIAGNRDNGGLVAVNRNWSSNPNDNIGFRVLAVHDTSFIQPPSIFPIS